MRELLDKIETYGFECEAGTLEACQQWIDLKQSISEEKTVYAVIGNTDLTEGRGQGFIKDFCETEATAIRLAKGGYVQGGNCPIEAIKLFKLNNRWYGPVTIKKPTQEDCGRQTAIDAKRTAINKARALGITDDELKLIQSVA